MCHGLQGGHGNCSFPNGIYQALMLPCFPESHHPEQPLPPQLQPEPPAQPKFPLLPSHRGSTNSQSLGLPLFCSPPSEEHQRQESAAPFTLGQLVISQLGITEGNSHPPPAAGASPAQGTAPLGHAPAPRPLCEGRVTSCPSLVLCWIPMDTSWAVGHRLTAQEPLTELLTEPVPTGTAAVYGNIHRLLQPTAFQ